MSRANQNAKEEFLSSISTKPVKCAEIVYTASSLWAMNEEDSPAPKKIFLKVGYNETDWEKFLADLDFDYDAGYGGQELFGTVWFEDSEEWMTRGEYDGSEWWEVHSIPAIPQHLI